MQLRKRTCARAPIEQLASAQRSRRRRSRVAASRSRGRRVACASFLAAGLAVLLACASTAHADVRTEARRHFRRGMELIAGGALDAGVAELRQAYDTLPHPNVLYNIGRAYAEGGRYEESLEYFERYLASDPPDREEVEGFVSALQARLGVTPEPEPEPAVRPDPSRGAEIGPEDVVAIRESARQIETLAEATDSESLRERARRMRRLADALEAAPPRGEGLPSPESAPTPPADEAAPVGGGAPDEQRDSGEGALALGEERLEVFEEEIVSASRFAESPLDAPNSTSIITRQDIRLSGLTDIAQLLRRVAGVEVMSNTPFHRDVGIRGLNRRQSNKVLFLIDGRTVRLDFLASPFINALPINVEDIERIEVIRGPAAAVYGADAFSGIVNIILQSPGAGESYLRVDGGSGRTARLATSVSGRRGPFALRFSGGTTRTDQYANTLDARRVDRDVSAIYSDRDEAMAITYFNGELRLGGEGYTARLGSGISSGSGTIQGISRLRQVAADDILFAQSHLTLTTPFGLGLRTYWNRFRTDVDVFDSPSGALDTRAALLQDVVDTELSFNRRFYLGIDQNVSLGVGHRYKRVEWGWLDATQTEQHVFAYIQDALALTETLRATLSVRLDRHPLLDDPQLSPRGSLVWRFLEGNALRFVAGTAFRSPSFLESYLDFENRTPIRAVTAIGRGNTSLDPERIVSVELGYMNQATDSFALEANAYYNRVLDEIQLRSVDTFTLGDGRSGQGTYRDEVSAFPVGELRFDNEDATLRQLGAELGLRVFPIDGLDLYANYAIHETSPVDATAFQGDPIRAEDQRTSLHKVNAGVQYRAPFGLDVSVDLHWVSDQVWVEQVTSPSRGVAFEAFPLGSYTLLNARVGIRLFADHLELGVVGTNLTGQVRRQHPFGQPVDTRVVGTAMVRY